MSGIIEEEKQMRGGGAGPGVTALRSWLLGEAVGSLQSVAPCLSPNETQ
jgi:hypothetical protein